MAGEITNGGLVAIRSKASPATGAKNEPSRTSMFGGAVEERVDPGDPEGPGVDVGGHHLAAVPGQVQRLDAAAGAEVQRPADRLADGEPGQRGGRGADAEDVVGADPVGGAVQARGQVADHPEVGVVLGVRAAVEAGGHLADAALEQALGAERVDQVGERRLGGGQRDRVLEQEQPGQRLDRRSPAGTAQAGHGLVAREGGVRLGTQRGRHPVVRVVRGLERVAQPAGHVAVHTPTPTGRRW